jgi:tRNA-dihydrouridine synthase C
MESVKRETRLADLRAILERESGGNNDDQVVSF